MQIDFLSTVSAIVALITGLGLWPVILIYVVLRIAIYVMGLAKKSSNLKIEKEQSEFKREYEDWSYKTGNMTRAQFNRYTGGDNGTYRQYKYRNRYKEGR